MPRPNPHALFLFTLLASCSTGQKDPVGGNKSDTVWVVVHHVAPSKRQVYEDWMTNVWYPTAQDVGERDADFREALLARRRLTPTRAERDGTWTYVFLYDRPPVLKGAEGGLGAVFKAAGWPDQRVATELARMERVIVRTEAGAMLQQEYSTAR
jgi:hypothetical protein